MRHAMATRSTLAHAVAAALCVAAGWTLDGCSSADQMANGVVGACDPGAPLSCVCPNGLPSMTTCLADGSGAQPCACNEGDNVTPNNAGGTAGAGVAPTGGVGGVGTGNGGGMGGGVGGMGAGGGISGMGASGIGGMGGEGAGGMSMMAGGGGTSAAGGSGPAAGSGGGAGMGNDALDNAAPSSGCGMADVPGSGSMTLDVDGVEREYIVTVPDDYDPSRPYRLIFAWHGLGGTAMQIASTYYGLASRSENSALFISAQGLPGTGQQAGLAAWSNTNDQDIAFTRAMLDWAKQSYCIDENRVFSVGMSNGGLMSNLVGCELGDVFRAIVAMSGGGPKGYALKPCVGQVAAWISHGNMDNNVPFSYGEMSRDYWTQANHCGMASMPVGPGTCLEYQDCDAGFPVQFCEFDGGHTVPSFAGEAGWSFLAQF